MAALEAASAARQPRPMPRVVFVTHPEVVIDPKVPIPQWPLSEIGRARMAAFAETLSARDVTAVWSSDERKAMDGAEIVAARLGVPHRTDPGLGENNRSATGYLPPPEFWDVVAAFFARPDESVRGWETARAAQARIVDAVSRLVRLEPTGGDIVVVSHGGVGRLLMARLQGVEIGAEDRPQHPGGGSWLEIDRERLAVEQSWRDIAD
ncbi:MAG TPA: histidine phosphatase family protein [Phenylobacterium sp.]|nr:histidine phosphatase family protein [Phenylobacterium sp.]